MVNPDQSMIKFDENEKPVIGIRTFAECAHYVRCIPYCNAGDVEKDDLQWCGPDFVITRRVGTEDDHALMMASIMRTSKHEDMDEFKKWVKKKKLEAKNERKDKIKKLLDVGIKNEDDSDEAEEEKEEEGKEGEKGEGPPEEDETVDNRVFICIGRNNSNQRQIWVMTINRAFDTVTFWDVKQHNEYVLKGRIKEGEEKFLKHYLAPVLTDEEKKKFKAERDANKSLATLGDGDAQSEFDGALGGGFQDDDDEEDADDDDEEDVENSDSDF